MRKISNTRITRHFNKYVLSGDENINPVIEITDKNSFKLIPFELTMGYITSTENGIRQNDNVNVFDYSTFSRVFTGLENVLAKWEDAYTITRETNDKGVADNFLTKAYGVGRSMRGIITDENLQAEFEASSISGDFLTEFTAETFDVQLDVDLQVTDLYKLYIIPQLKEEKWLYISNANKYYNQDKSFHHATITFTTLNNKIEKTGRAVEEFIQRSAAGEGYAWPLIDSDGNITVDDVRARDIPVTSIQLEGAGAWAMGTIFCYGRPTIQKTENGFTQGTFNPKIEAPRLLIPYQMETAIPSPINTRPSAETDWLVGKFKPALEEDFTDWKGEMAASYDLTQRATYEGTLKSIENDSVVDASNPVNEGTRNSLLWDNGWNVPVSKTYNTETDAYTGNKLDLQGQFNLTQILCHNIFGLSHLSALPLTVEQNIAWKLNDIPIIGGFLSKLTLGIPIGWTNTAIKVKMDDVLLAIPASLRNYANVLIKQSDKLRIDLNTFTDEAAKNDAVEFSGIKATGSIWKCSLTDNFQKTINGKAYIFSTVDLKQVGATGKAVTNGEADYKYADDEFLLWDETCKPAPRNTDTAGYVIDTSTFKALAKLDYRETFFSNDTQVWSGTYQTTSKFTKSIRDWTNTTKFSNWELPTSNTVDYPASIFPPNPPNTNNPKLDTKISFENNNTIYIGDFFNPTIPSYDELLKQEPNLDIAYGEKKTFDTTAIGGINAFKANYKTLKLTFKTNIKFQDRKILNTDVSKSQQQIVDVIINDLVNTNKVEIPLFTVDNQILGALDGGGNNPVEIQNVDKIEYFINISLDVNKINYSLGFKTTLTKKLPAEQGVGNLSILKSNGFRGMSNGRTQVLSSIAIPF